MLANSIFSVTTPEPNPFLGLPKKLTKEEGDVFFEAAVARKGGFFFDGVFPHHPRKILLAVHWETGTFYRNVQYMKLPDEFTDYERSLFVKKTIIIKGKETEIYEHEKGGESGLFEDRIARAHGLIEKGTEEKEHRIHFKQMVRAGSPQQSSIKDCADFVLQNKVLFYVGAGISADLLPTNQAIFKTVGYTPHASYDPFMKTLLNNPERIVNEGFMFDWGTFLDKNRSPSVAHKAMIELAQLMGCQVVTTNTDPYFEKGGIKPYCLWHKNFREHWNSEAAKKVKVIITIGCAEDAVGFLGMYSHYSPEGRIIALNLSSPAYLGRNDLFVKGDVQETLPALLKLIKDNKLLMQDVPEQMFPAHQQQITLSKL